MIFTQPIQDTERTLPDYREMKAAIHISQGQGMATFNNKIGTIDELHKRTPLISSHQNGIVPEIHTDGIFYHPIRKKWIIWRGEVITQRQVKNHVLYDLRPGHNLKVKFPKNEYEVIDPNQIVYQEVLDFGDNTKTLPVKPQFVDLIDFSRANEIKSERQPNGTLRVQIPLIGARKAFEYTSRPARLDYKAHINIWPNLPGWKTYWVSESFNLLEGFAKKKDIKTIPFSFNQKSGTLEQCKPSSWSLTEDEIKENMLDHVFGMPYSQWPDLISIEESSVKGCLIYNGAPTQVMNDHHEAVHIGLDFGTARSVICIASDGIGEHSFRGYITNHAAQDATTWGQGDNQNISFSHRGRSIAGEAQYHDETEIDNYLSLATGHSKYKTNKNLNEFPRAMVLETGLMTPQNEDAKDQLKQFQIGNYLPFHNYTLVPPGRFGQSDALSQYRKADKWNPEYYNDNHVIEGFFKQVLILALAESWSIQSNAIPTLSCSIPLAFNMELKEGYRQKMMRAIDWLSEHVIPANSSINWNQQLISESKAAYSAAMIYQNPANREFTVVADLGGGTLDISIWTNSQMGDNLLISDSVSLGADHLLETLISLTGRQGSLNKTMIYLFGYERIQRIWDITDQTWMTFNKIIERWLLLISAYIARTICAPYENNRNQFGDIGRINILLAGGGWKTFDARKWTPNILKEKLQEDIKVQMGALSPDFKPDVRVHTRLYAAGLDKIAIAGGLHSTQNLHNLTDGLIAPNGFPEKDSNGDLLPWHTMVHDTQRWLGYPDVDMHELTPPIQGLESEYAQLTQDEMDALCATVQQKFTRDDCRKRTFAALFFEKILKNLQRDIR